MRYVAKELWHGRSAKDESPKDVGRAMWRSINEMMLVRYFIHIHHCFEAQVIKRAFLDMSVLDRAKDF